MNIYFYNFMNGYGQAFDNIVKIYKYAIEYATKYILYQKQIYALILRIKDIIFGVFIYNNN